MPLRLRTCKVTGCICKKDRVRTLPLLVPNMSKYGAVVSPKDDKTVEKEVTVETEKMTKTGVVAEIEGMPGIPTVRIGMGTPTNETLTIEIDHPPEDIKGITKTMAIDHHPHHILDDPITEVTRRNSRSYSRDGRRRSS